eukprot:m.272320 g.272320  ORF g.272320 m.272320 type:complete len:318 (+) comp40560_c1_seq3:182-1135(+)
MTSESLVSFAFSGSIYIVYPMPLICIHVSRSQYECSMAYLLFLVAVFFGGINPVSSACTGCTSGCTSLSIGAGGYESIFFSCKDGYLPTLTLLDVSDGDSDNDGFTVTVMDGDNYQKFTNKQSYSYAANVGTGAVGSKSYTCSQNEGFDYKQAAGTVVYIVIYCTNILQTCHVQYKTGQSCTPTDPCLGVNCNHGTCFGGVCKCEDGYTGANCDVAPNPCADVLCGDYGTCSSGLCNCDEGYNGTPCTQNQFVHDSFGKAKLIAIISGSGGAFVIIVITVGFLLVRRSRRRRGEMPATNEALLGDKAMSSEPFTATT